MRASLREISWPVLLVLSLSKLALHLVTSSGYGHFRDELYYLASTDHLAWGYVEHPPLSIALLWLTKQLLGESLLAVRFLPAVAGAATVLMTGLLTRELGGGARAQFLASLAVIVSPFFLTVGHFFSMNVFDTLAWVTLGYLFARILVTHEPRLWLWFGVIAGFGLLNKVSVGFLGLALVVGLVVTPARRWLANPWLWVGGVIAALLFAPHVLWQIEHGWPTLEFQANARELKNMPLSIGEFGAQQILMGNPGVLPLWLLGLTGLLFSTRFTEVRALGLVYPVLFVLFAATNGKSYYLAPVYPLLYAAGASMVEPWLERATWRTPAVASLVVLLSLPALPIGLPVLPPERVVAWTNTIGMTAPALEVGERPALPQSLADMFGWTELVDTVERTVNSLPTEERSRAVVFVENYGEAGALDVLGAGRGLPPVLCGHNSYWEWGPSKIDGPVVSLHYTREQLERWFASVERVDTVTCDWCMPGQSDSPVHVARGLKISFDEFLLAIKRYR